MAVPVNKAEIYVRFCLLVCFFVDLFWGFFCFFLDCTVQLDVTLSAGAIADGDLFCKCSFFLIIFLFCLLVLFIKKNKKKTKC